MVDVSTTSPGRWHRRHRVDASSAASARSRSASSGARESEAARCRDYGEICAGNADCCSATCGPKDRTGRRTCSCQPGNEPCHDACVDSAHAFQSDVSNCGACGHVCPRSHCQIATCSAGVCGFAPDPKAIGTSCDDGNKCTNNDLCQSDGSCAGTLTICTAIDQCHDVGTCNPRTGVCSNPAKANGTACNDGNALARKMTRARAAFAPAQIRSSARPRTNVIRLERARRSTGQCSDPLKPDGSACNDEDTCTQTDTCQSGVCTGGNPVICTALDACHDAGVCNSQTGTCSTPKKSDGTVCNADNNACTADTCQDGECVAGAPKDCSTDAAFNDACNTGVCNTTTGQCEAQAKTDGTSCVATDLCYQSGSCQAGVCVGSNPVVCTPQDQCHTAGTCDSSTGRCSNPQKSNGTSCSDNNACTNTDTCQNGVCTSGTEVTCDPPGPCQQPGRLQPCDGAMRIRQCLQRNLVPRRRQMH